MVDSLNHYIHHIDDEGSWVKYSQLSQTLPLVVSPMKKHR